MSDATEPAEPAADDDDWGCYRHPYESAGVKCTRCDRPICPKCMITAPVGFQCPECVKGAPVVRRYSEMRRPSSQQMVVTTALIAVNVAVFLVSISGGGSMMSSRGNRLAVDYALFGPAVADGDWYRLITAGFLHYGLLHVGFNMFILYQLGQLLEPAFGRVRFALLYTTALLGGSVGALLLSPNSLTAGASGAVFGLMAAAAVALRHRGINVMQTSIGSLLVINLLLTFAIPRISIGGHLGGLAGGAVAGLMLLETERHPNVGNVAVAALAVLLLGAGYAIA
jgi:membrane associated rhomboid family serine protease